MCTPLRCRRIRFPAADSWTRSSVTMPVSGGGLTVTKESADRSNRLATGGVEMVSGEHYIEVPITKDGASDGRHIMIGVTRPDLDLETYHYGTNNAWYLHPYSGGLYGQGKSNESPQGKLAVGDRVGVLLNLDEGWLRFYVNGKVFGPGFPSGVTGPVVIAVELIHVGEQVLLLPDAPKPPAPGEHQ